LLAELGVDSALSEITDLRHVRSNAEKRAAEEAEEAFYAKLNSLDMVA
jgi:hypothetical protein